MCSNTYALKQYNKNLVVKQYYWKGHDYGRTHFALRNKNCVSAEQLAHRNVLVG